MQLLCVALILVAVGAQRYGQPYIPRDKPGFCPPNDGIIGTCVDYCTSDDSCPGSQKCCVLGCGRSCVNPSSVDCSAVYCAPITCRYPVRPPGQCCKVCSY